MTVFPRKIGGPVVPTHHHSSILFPSRISSNFTFAQNMVAQTRQMKHKLQPVPTLTGLPNELLYTAFNHVESEDLLSLAPISRRLTAVAMRLYLGPWQEVQKDYSVIGGYSTGTPRNFFALHSLRLSLATPYIPSMTLMFSLNFAEELDEVLRYHRGIPKKHYPSLYIDLTSTTNECIACQIHAERLHRFCEGLVRLRCVSFECHRTQGGGGNKIAHMTYIFVFKVRQTPPPPSPPAIYGSNMTICGWLSNAMSVQYGCPKVPAGCRDSL